MQDTESCFAVECGPDSSGHTRALEGPFFDPGSKADKVEELPVAIEQVHTKKNAVLMQNAAPTPWAPDGLEQANT